MTNLFTQMYGHLMAPAASEPTTKKYDMRRIMTRAHALRKAYGLSMSEALKWAWAEAKPGTPSDEQTLFNLEMKDRWNESDYALAAELRRRIKAA